MVALATLTFGTLLVSAILPAFNLLRVAAMACGGTRWRILSCSTFLLGREDSSRGWRGWLLITLLLHGAVSIVGGASAAGFRASVMAWVAGPYADEVSLGPGVPMTNESGYGAAIASAVLNGACCVLCAVAMCSPTSGGSGARRDTAAAGVVDSADGAAADPCQVDVDVDVAGDAEAARTGFDAVSLAPSSASSSSTSAAAAAALPVVWSPYSGRSESPSSSYVAPPNPGYSGRSESPSANSYMAPPNPPGVGVSASNTMQLPSQAPVAVQPLPLQQQQIQQQIRHLQQLLRQFQTGSSPLVTGNGADDGSDFHSDATRMDRTEPLLLDAPRAQMQSSTPSQVMTMPVPAATRGSGAAVAVVRPRWLEAPSWLPSGAQRRDSQGSLSTPGVVGLFDGNGAASAAGSSSWASRHRDAQAVTVAGAGPGATGAAYACATPGRAAIGYAPTGSYRTVEDDVDPAPW